MQPPTIGPSLPSQYLLTQINDKGPQQPVLPVGKVMTATVISQTAGQGLQLQLGQQVLNTKTALSFNPGDTIAVKIQQVGNSVVLKLLSLPSQQAKLSEHLRTWMPQQQPMTQLFSNLNWIKQNPNSLNTLPKPVQALIVQVLNQILPSQSIRSSKDLQLAIKHSGVFLEHNLQQLSKGQPVEGYALSRDFKAQLLRLVAQLKQHLPAHTNNKQAQTPHQQFKPQVETVSAKQVPSSTHGKPISSTHTPSAELVKNEKTKEALLVQPEKLTRKETKLDKPTTVQRQEKSQQTPHLPGTQKTTYPQTSANVTTKATASYSMASSSALSADSPPMKSIPPKPQVRAQATLPAIKLGQEAVQELLKQVSNTLARLSLSQAASIKTETTQGFQIQMEFPIAHLNGVDIIPLLIEEEVPEQSDDNEETENRSGKWIISLAFDIIPLGPVQVKTVLQGKIVSTHFWAENANSVQEIESCAEQLQKNLRAQGLQAEVSCHLGKLSVTNKTESTQLVNIKA